MDRHKQARVATEGTARPWRAPMGFGLPKRMQDLTPDQQEDLKRFMRQLESMPLDVLTLIFGYDLTLYDWTAFCLANSFVRAWCDRLSRENPSRFAQITVILMRASPLYQIMAVAHNERSDFYPYLTNDMSQLRHPVEREDPFVWMYVFYRDIWSIQGAKPAIRARGLTFVPRLSWERAIILSLLSRSIDRVPAFVRDDMLASPSNDDFFNIIEDVSSQELKDFLLGQMPYIASIVRYAPLFFPTTGPVATLLSKTVRVVAIFGRARDGVVSVFDIEHGASRPGFSTQTDVYQLLKLTGETEQWAERLFNYQGTEYAVGTPHVFDPTGVWEDNEQHYMPPRVYYLEREETSSDLATEETIKSVAGSGHIEPTSGTPEAVYRDIILERAKNIQPLQITDFRIENVKGVILDFSRLNTSAVNVAESLQATTSGLTVWVKYPDVETPTASGIVIRAHYGDGNLRDTYTLTHKKSKKVMVFEFRRSLFVFIDHATNQMDIHQEYSLEAFTMDTPQPADLAHFGFVYESVPRSDYAEIQQRFQQMIPIKALPPAVIAKRYREMDPEASDFAEVEFLHKEAETRKLLAELDSINAQLIHKQGSSDELSRAWEQRPILLERLRKNLVYLAAREHLFYPSDSGGVWKEEARKFRTTLRQEQITPTIADDDDDDDDDDNSNPGRLW